MMFAIIALLHFDCRHGNSRGEEYDVTWRSGRTTHAGPPACRTPRSPRGRGGETHQTASGDTLVLTTQECISVADDLKSLRLGARGPTLLEDFHFREKIFHFDHEHIPERVFHARGYGAHGYFETFGPLADLFQRKGEKMTVFVRFSTVKSSFSGNETRGQFDFASRFMPLGRPDVLARDMIGMIANGATVALPRINAPTPVVVGDKDMTTPGSGEFIAEHVPGAGLVTISPCQARGAG